MDGCDSALPRRAIFAAGWLGLRPKAVSQCVSAAQRPPINGATFLCTAAVLLAAALRSNADEPSLSPHGDTPQCELWLISSRQLGCHTAELAAPMALQYRRSAAGCWERAAPEEFFADRSPPSTVIYVHGNRYTATDAVDIGSAFFRQFAAASHAPLPQRFVIWSWPSEPIPGVHADLRKKASVSDCHAHYLAQLIERIPAGVPVCMIGHSYGARLIAATLHLLAGAQIDGCALARFDVSSSERPLRAVMMAAAIDHDALLPGKRYEGALCAVELLLVLKNPLDPVLKRYPLLDRYRFPQALGVAGMADPPSLCHDGEKLLEVDISNWIGRAHAWHRYVGSPSTLSLIRHATEFEPAVSPVGR